MNKPVVTTSNAISAKMVVFEIPKDQGLLAAIGTVTLRHSQMDHVLRMTIKTLSGVSIPDAMNATRFEGSRILRERIRKLAKPKLGEGAALIQLQALLERCSRATEKRNELVHGVWYRNLDSETLMRTDGHEAKEIPTVATLESLAVKLLQLAGELNAARMKGFLAEALASKK
jgi:hypothetical protein